MKTAMIQMPMATSIEGNVTCIRGLLGEAKQQGVDVAVFPECAVTGYHPEMGLEITPSRINEVLVEIGETCARLEICAIVGCPFYGHGPSEKPWNAAVIFDKEGKVVAAFPKVIFTRDEINNDIYVPGVSESRTPFSLEGTTCAVLICIEYAGEVGDFTGEYMRTFLRAMDRAPKVVFVIGVMDLGPDSQAPELAQEAAQEFNAHFVVVNASHWGFGVPSGCLGGSLATSPDGGVLAVAPYNEASVTVVDLVVQPAETLA